MSKSAITLAIFVIAAAAQSVIIASPIANGTLNPGETFVVDVDRPATLTGSQDVSVVIGLLSCVGLAPSGSCDSVNPAGNLGRVLFSGPYTPTPVGNGHADLAQNYTVQVPSNFEPGHALVAVAHFGLIIGTEPFLEVVSQQVIVVGT
ncbi:hypothetical protein K466DRAFT_600921 [Polyporus arcularius HHB13444]|uniref:Lytic polysaccharide monooxygenase n=1 Tax=Polyporus arcularius HHB13444 TaxID=1314778 RepID=A0A5C3PII5_9APHY|nr:hypothetical protein K466DRAFT_600921 [Polyporus arcularius HHB13444]